MKDLLVGFVIGLKELLRAVATLCPLHARAFAAGMGSGHGTASVPMLHIEWKAKSVRLRWEFLHWQRLCHAGERFAHGELCIAGME